MLWNLNLKRQRNEGWGIQTAILNGKKGYSVINPKKIKKIKNQLQYTDHPLCIEHCALLFILMIVII